jgi:hypothetical protein
MITVDGEAVNPPDAEDCDEEGDDAEALRSARLELKLCRALVSLKPPHDLSVMVYARTVEVLKTLRRYDVTDDDVILPADLSDEKLREAAEIVRAFRALPFFRAKGFQGRSSFRAVLGEYALDLAAELDARATRDS